MEAYEIILNHYYSYISLKNSTAIFHSCQTSFVSCSMNIEQPCDIIIKKKCDYASRCELNNVCQKCNALDSESFSVLMRYFNGHEPIKPDSFNVCFGERIPYKNDLVELEEFKISDESNAWIVGRVLVMCLFTEKFHQSSKLLSKMVTLFCGEFDVKSTDIDLQEFLNAFNIKGDSIPLKSNLGAMLNQALEKMKIYMKEGYLSIPAITKIVVLKLKGYCLKSQSQLKY